MSARGRCLCCGLTTIGQDVPGCEGPYWVIRHAGQTVRVMMGEAAPQRAASEAARLGPEHQASEVSPHYHQVR